MAQEAAIRIWGRTGLLSAALAVVILLCGGAQGGCGSNSGGGGSAADGTQYGCSIGDIRAARHFAHRMSDRVFGPGYWPSLAALWDHESGFCYLATNPTSGATGIPQLLPSAHREPPNWGDYHVQIRWGIHYIARHYGNPSNAWSFWQGQSPHWY